MPILCKLGFHKWRTIGVYFMAALVPHPDKKSRQIRTKRCEHCPAEMSELVP